MSTKPTTVRAADVDDAALRAADVGAVFDHFVSGQPLDPTLVERIAPGLSRSRRTSGESTDWWLTRYSSL